MSALHTRICDLLGISVPIVQTGMGWVSGPELTAATSAAGGLGILAGVTMTTDQLQTAIAAVQSHTTAPFGVNLRADQPNAEAVVDLLISQQVKVASFAGPPRRGLIDRLKSAAIVTIPTIGAPKHAVKMASWGVDAVIAQGSEGGGHTGTIATTQLLPAVCRAVDIPVLGAGGFCDGRGLVAALAYGADGIAMGTRFLLTQESPVPESVKAVYLNTSLSGTVVTEAIDGYPQRVIRTPFVDRLERSGWLSGLLRSLRHAWAFRKVTNTSAMSLLQAGLKMQRSSDLPIAQVAMAANAPMMTKATMVDGKADVGIFPTGQVTGQIQHLPTVDELISEIVDEAERILERLRKEQ